MNYMEVGKAGIIGGVAMVVLQIVVGYAAHSISYYFGFLALLLGGFIAGWMISKKQDEAVVAGVVSGIVFAILGLIILFPMLGGSHTSPIGGLLVSIVLGAVGGFAGQYLAAQQGSGKSSGKKK